MKKICLLALAVTLLSGFSMPARKAKVLIIGDSISIGYYPFVKKELSDIAVVTHNKGNGEFTAYGLKHVSEWIGKGHWDLIQFNWGLWDIAYRAKGSMKLDEKAGVLTTSPEDYRRNLEALVKILKTTGAKLVFVTTTYVPSGEPGRSEKNVKKYNRIALKVMKENGVMVNDISGASGKIHDQYGKGEDNVHYTEKGYEELSSLVSAFLRKALQ